MALTDIFKDNTLKINNLLSKSIYSICDMGCITV